MKPKTVNFIQTLLLRELKHQKSLQLMDDKELQYIDDLEDASLDFSNWVKNDYTSQLILKEMEK